MKKVITAQVGADGVLTVPLDKEDACKFVRVSLEPIGESVEATAPVMSREEWLKFIESTAGAITDPTFMRHSQGEYEQRDQWA